MFGRGETLVFEENHRRAGDVPPEFWHLFLAVQPRRVLGKVSACLLE